MVSMSGRHAVFWGERQKSALLMWLRHDAGSGQATRALARAPAKPGIPAVGVRASATEWLMKSTAVRPLALFSGGGIDRSTVCLFAKYTLEMSYKENSALYAVPKV